MTESLTLGTGIPGVALPPIRELSRQIDEFGRGEKDSPSLTQRTVPFLLINRTRRADAAEIVADHVEPARSKAYHELGDGRRAVALPAARHRDKPETIREYGQRYRASP